MENPLNTLSNSTIEKLIKTYLGFVELFLALRFVTIFLALEGKFAEWILVMTQSLFSPFSQWVSPISTGTLFTIDFATLTTMLLYVLTAEFLIVLFKIIHYLGNKYAHTVEK